MGSVSQEIFRVMDQGMASVSGSSNYQTAMLMPSLIFRAWFGLASTIRLFWEERGHPYASICPGHPNLPDECRSHSTSYCQTRSLSKAPRKLPSSRYLRPKRNYNWRGEWKQHRKCCPQASTRRIIVGFWWSMLASTRNAKEIENYIRRFHHQRGPNRRYAIDFT